MSSSIHRAGWVYRSSPGFTILELMAVVAIIGVILAIAYPAYTDFVERSRRSEATEALQNLSTLQEQYYNDNKAYAGSLGDLGMPATTENGYYELDIDIASATTIDGTLQSYILRAEPQGSQASDTDCAPIRLDSGGDKTPADCW